MSSLEREVAELKAQIQSSKTLDEVPIKQSLALIDKIAIFDKQGNQTASITAEVFINQLASGNIVFETELEQDGTTPTGRILVKQQDQIRLIVGRAGQSNQYSDLDGLPDLTNFLTIDQVISQNNKVRLIDFGGLNFNPDIDTKKSILVTSFNLLNSSEKTINEDEIVLLSSILNDTLNNISTEEKYIITRGKGNSDLTINDLEFLTQIPKGNPQIGNYTILNSTPGKNEFEIGNFILGEKANGDFIIGKVLGLPFDENDSSKVKELYKSRNR